MALLSGKGILGGGSQQPQRPQDDRWQIVDLNPGPVFWPSRPEVRPQPRQEVRPAPSRPPEVRPQPRQEVRPAPSRPEVRPQPRTEPYVRPQPAPAPEPEPAPEPAPAPAPPAPEPAPAPAPAQAPVQEGSPSVYEEPIITEATITDVNGNTYTVSLTDMVVTDANGNVQNAIVSISYDTMGNMLLTLDTGDVVMLTTTGEVMWQGQQTGVYTTAAPVTDPTAYTYTITDAEGNTYTVDLTTGQVVSSDGTLQNTVVAYEYDSLGNLIITLDTGDKITLTQGGTVVYNGEQTGTFTAASTEPSPQPPPSPEEEEYYVYYNGEWYIYNMTTGEVINAETGEVENTTASVTTDEAGNIYITFATGDQVMMSPNGIIYQNGEPVAYYYLDMPVVNEGLQQIVITQTDGDVYTLDATTGVLYDSAGNPVEVYAIIQQGDGSTILLLADGTGLYISSDGNIYQGDQLIGTAEFVYEGEPAPEPEPAPSGDTYDELYTLLMNTLNYQYQNWDSLLKTYMAAVDAALRQMGLVLDPAQLRQMQQAMLGDVLAAAGQIGTGMEEALWRSYMGSIPQALDALAGRGVLQSSVGSRALSQLSADYLKQLAQARSEAYEKALKSASLGQGVYGTWLDAALKGAMAPVTFMGGLLGNVPVYDMSTLWQLINTINLMGQTFEPEEEEEEETTA